MSIETEVSSMIQNIQADYEALENVGADLTNVDKNIENIASVVNGVYDTLPKATGTGSNITLQPTLKGKLQIDKLLGDTTQEGTPTPSSPQDIEVVTGEQEVVVQNRNLANVSKTQIGKAWNNSSNSARAILVIPIEHSTQYTISYGSLRSVEGVYYGYRTDEETAGTGVSQMSTNPTTITTNDTNNYIIFQFNKTSISLADIQAINLQLEKGSTKTDYVEHQEQTKTLSLGDIELCKIGTYQDRIFETSGKNLWGGYNEYNVTNASVNYSNKANGIITASGTTSGAYSTSCTIDNAIANNVYITLQAGTYSVKCEQATTNLRIQIHDIETRTQLLQLTSSSASTFTLTGTTKVLAHLSVANSGTSLNTAFYIQIEEGSSSTSYEPYGSDKWYVENNVGIRNLNNATSFTYDATNSIWYYSLSQRKSNTDTTQTIFSDKLFWNGNFNGVASAGSNMTNYQIATNNNGTSKNIFIKNTNYNTVDNFMNWLHTLNPIIYYQLATPTYTEITNETLIEELNELEKMMSYSGTTNISVSGNLPMILNVSALKGE